jgi:hypothetical protein
MIHEDTDVIFPPRVIPVLRSLRGQSWQELVTRVSEKPIGHEERRAFVFMMTRLNGCVTCHADSFRAMRGCTQCAIQTIRRLRGKDEELLAGYEEALQEIRMYIQQK